MIKSLRESKAKLSELVERASRGEDVIITVRGKGALDERRSAGWRCRYAALGYRT